MSLHRLYIVTHPKDSNVSLLKVKLILICVWLFCLVYIVPIVLVDSVVYVIPYKLQCDFTFVEYNNDYTISRTVIMTILLSTILLTNIIIFIVASRQSSGITGDCLPRRAAVITISSICWAYLLSYTPFMLCEILWLHSPPSWYGLFYSYMLTINSIVNPVIYTITNSKFRDYMLRIFRQNTNDDVVRARFRRLTQVLT